MLKLIQKTAESSSSFIALIQTGRGDWGIYMRLVVLEHGPWFVMF